MDQVLGREVLEFATVYVDDLLITSTTWQEHCKRTEMVLNRLSQNNITLKLEKSQLLTNKLNFLGFVLTETGITTSPEKVEAIQNFPQPKNLRQLQSFLGICNYYRRFHKNYSQLTSRFQHLLSTKYRWKWSEEDSATFRTIKENFLEKVMLHHPDFNQRFFINCNASDISVGAELYQESKEGDHLVISFASRVLNNSERNYNVTEKELLSVVFACSKFRTYILGYPITVRSDHRSISFLQRCKLSHGRLTRWILALQEYHITWEYVPGKKNAVADALSRVNLDNGTFEVEREDIGKVYYALIRKKELSDLLKKMKEEQATDPKISQILPRIQNNDTNITPYYQLHEELVFTKSNTKTNHWKLYVPKSLEEGLIENYHNMYGHMRPAKVVSALEEHVFMKGINKKVKTNCKKMCTLSEGEGEQLQERRSVDYYHFKQETGEGVP